MRALDFFENSGPGAIGQLEIERHEIDPMIVDHGQGMAAILRRKDVEVLFKNLGQRRTRRRLVVHDQDRGFLIERVVWKGSSHHSSCMMVGSFRQENQNWLL